MKDFSLLYGKSGMSLHVPDNADILQAAHAPALPDVQAAVAQALAKPIGCSSLAELIRRRQPRSVAISVSDITRPVPNKLFLPAIMKTLNDCGISDSRIVIIVGTGMHRSSTPAEHEQLVGREILSRVEVMDHRADDPSTLVKISDNPPVSICRRFAEADFHIVTGFIEPHFMAGFSGGRKGICPALVDLATVQRFHGYATLADPHAENGLLENNPCHQIALQVARAVGVDFLFNVAITADRQIAGIYCGDLQAAHEEGCKAVAGSTSVEIDHAYDLVVTCGGGYPLDQTFYQTVKGMVAALPALESSSHLMIVSHCGEGIGSKSYTDIMLKYDGQWRQFLSDAAADSNTHLDQWQYQMHARVLGRIGAEKLHIASDGFDGQLQGRLSVTPVSGSDDAKRRAQQFIDQFVKNNPGARIAVLPEGPYTLLRRK